MRQFTWEGLLGPQGRPRYAPSWRRPSVMTRVGPAPFDRRYGLGPPVESLAATRCSPVILLICFKQDDHRTLFQMQRWSASSRSVGISITEDHSFGRKASALFLITTTFERSLFRWGKPLSQQLRSNLLLG